MVSRFDLKSINRTLFKLRLRTLLIAIVLFGVGLGWLVNKARKQAIAVAAIQKIGGSVLYDWEYVNGEPAGANAKSPWPDFLVHTFGPDFFSNVTAVTISSSIMQVPEHAEGWQVIDSEIMNHVASLKNIEWIYVVDNKLFNDACLPMLSGLNRLRRMDCSNSGISGEGLALIKHINSIEQLDITHINITDKTISNLSELAGLRQLSLDGTHLSDAGLLPLLNLKHLQVLEIRSQIRSQIGSAGLVYLSDLDTLNELTIENSSIEKISCMTKCKNLKILNVVNAHICDTEFLEFIRASNLEHLSVDENPGVTDRMIPELANILKSRQNRTLLEIGFSGTSVTNAGVDFLRQRNPALRIFRNY